MILEWDEAKNTINKIKHGLDFRDLYDFDWENPLIIPDKRHTYGEARFLAYGMIGKRLHVVVFTHRDEAIRIIGARKANDRERKTYEKAG